MNVSTINCKFTLSAKQDAQASKTLLGKYHLALPIMVEGDLKNPKVSLDLGNIAQQYINQAIGGKDDKDNKLKDLVKDKLPKAANKFINNLLK